MVKYCIHGGINKLISLGGGKKLLFRRKFKEYFKRIQAIKRNY